MNTSSYKYKYMMNFLWSNQVNMKIMKWKILFKVVVVLILIKFITNLFVLTPSEMNMRLFHSQYKEILATLEKYNAVTIESKWFINSLYTLSQGEDIYIKMFMLDIKQISKNTEGDLVFYFDNLFIDGVLWYMYLAYSHDDILPIIWKDQEIFSLDGFNDWYIIAEDR